MDRLKVKMGKKKGIAFMFGDLIDFYHHILEEKPLLPFLIPLVLFFWTIERWFFSLSNWVPLVLAVWATLQYGNYQRQILAEDLSKKWKQIALRTTPITPLEHCEWLNKLFMEVWPNYFSPKFSIRFASIVEKRLKSLNSRLIEKIELLEFSLGSFPPSLGLQGMRWSTSGDQKIMRLGFDWDTNEMSILLLAKLAKPLMGTARIVINSLHLKGDLILMPVLDGKAILYSFVSAPEVRIGIAFGSGGSQTLPATELPGVSSLLVKLFTDTLVKTMVEPRRRCFSLPAVDLQKKAVGCSIHVTVISGSKLSRNSLRASPSRKLQQNNSSNGALEVQHHDERDMQTFVEVEVEELTRRTPIRAGSCPRWNSSFNMVLHEDTGILRFHLFEATPNSVNVDYLTSCEVKVKYAVDDSTTYWAIGPNSSVIAKHAQFCGKEVDMVVPFEGVNSGELTVRLVLKEWEFSDGPHSSLFSRLSSPHQSINGLSNFLPKTGRRIKVSVVEGKDFMVKGKGASYVKLQYGKALHKTRPAYASTPTWNQKFEFEEIGDGEYLKIKCFAEETLGDEIIGSARVNLEGLVDGLVRDVWIPLEKVESGELRLQIEAVRVDDSEGSRGSSKGSGNGWVELALIEARDLVAADLRGTSDPFVRVHYGNLKRSTKVMYKTLTPRWDQTFEFPDDGSDLVLHMKDHNALLPTSSIGDCVVEYQRLPPNQMFDKWIPLQGVKKGEIHVQVTRKIPELQKRPSLVSEPSLSKAHQTSTQVGQMKKMLLKTQSQIAEGDLDGLSTTLSEMESLEDTQEEYMVQLETEQTLLLDKIKELGEEMFNTPPSQNRKSPVN